MQSVIKEIYLDNGSYSEKIKLSDEYWKMQEEYDEIFEKLLKGATREQQDLLNALFETGGGLECLSGEINFAEGFKLGVRLVAEAYE